LALNALLLGPQGSGKGTQASRISAEYGIPHVSTGDMLRASIAAGDALGERVKEIVERGDLVPDDLMVDLIRGRLSAPDAAEGFVLDGFPRTMAQAEALDEMLREIGHDLGVVFELQVPEDVAVDRLLARAADERRTDDTPEAIRRRLELYREQTLPLVEHYRTKGILVGIHGDRAVNEVFNEIQQVLDRLEDAAA
jgi:adenylate kinase